MPVYALCFCMCEHVAARVQFGCLLLLFSILFFATEFFAKRGALHFS